MISEALQPVNARFAQIVVNGNSQPDKVTHYFICAIGVTHSLFHT